METATKDWLSNLRRIQPDQPNTTLAFKNNFKENVKLFAKENNDRLIVHDDAHREQYLRIMTWNVRYFTDIDDNKSIDEIINVINKINPDILCLNEITEGHHMMYETGLIFELRLPQYILVSLCNNTPAWYSSMYGNAILMKKDLHKKMCDADFARQYAVLDTNEKCWFNQLSRTFTEPVPTTKILDKMKINVVGTMESRCFIKISMGDFDIFCTHLEAYNKKVRFAQFDELMKNVTRKSIILGDLNIINTESYPNKKDYEWTQLARVNSLTDDSEILYIKKKYGLKDSFELSGNKYAGFTTWTNTIVDYILFTPEWDTDKTFKVVTQIYLTTASDHCPLYVDIQSEFINTVLVLQQIVTTSIDEIGTFEHFGYSHSTDFYHTSPLAAFDWFNNGKINKNKYDFSDPYLTGNFFMTLGSEGVYTATTIEEALKFLPYLIARTDQTNFNEGFLYNVGLLYKFRLRDTYDLNNKMCSTTNLYNQYDKENDTKYDFIQKNDKNKRIGKITKLSYDKRTGIHKAFKLVQVSIIIAREISTPNEHFAMALQYINNLYNADKKNNIYYDYPMKINGYPTEITSIADVSIIPEKIRSTKIGDDEYFIYDLWAESQAVGGYEQKYHKYKLKYHNLKKTR